MEELGVLVMGYLREKRDDMPLSSLLGVLGGGMGLGENTLHPGPRGQMGEGLTPPMSPPLPPPATRSEAPPRGVS